MPIDQAADNLSFICGKIYISKILNEMGINGTTNPKYEFSSKSNNEIIIENFFFSNKFGLKLDVKDKSPLVIYWIPKMHKKSIGARFFVATKNCSTRLISKAVSKDFISNTNFL